MPFEHVVGGPPRLAVERVHREPGLRVRFRGEVLVVLDAADAVLGAEQRDQRDARRRLEDVDGAASGAIAPGVIGDQPDPLALQQREAVAAQHVDAGEHRCAPATVTRTAAAGMDGVTAGIAVLAARRRAIDDRRGGNRRDPRAKRRDVAGAVGMQAVRQEHHVTRRTPDRSTATCR